MLSCLIPGPRKYKNLDSWLWPMVEEMKKLGQHHTPFVGINASTQKRFCLRAHILNVAGDGIALAEAMGLASCDETNN